MEYKPSVAGRIRVYSVQDQDWTPVTPERKNLVMYDWASIAAILLTTGNADYRISGMYMEFKNVSNVNTAIAAPTYGPANGMSYYNGLASSPDTDFLRVPLVASRVAIVDPVNYPLGNEMHFFAQSQGVTGINGKAFGPAFNSKVYGFALVAMPVAGDRTRDLIYSRNYLAAADQQVVLSSSQVGLEWLSKLT